MPLRCRTDLCVDAPDHRLAYQRYRSPAPPTVSALDEPALSDRRRSSLTSRFSARGQWSRVSWPDPFDRRESQTCLLPCSSCHRDDRSGVAGDVAAGARSRDLGQSFRQPGFGKAVSWRPQRCVRATRRRIPRDPIGFHRGAAVILPSGKGAVFHGLRKRA